MRKVRRINHRRSVCRTALSGIPGYHARCTCGWQGPFRHQRIDALDDYVLHLPDRILSPYVRT